MTAENFCYWLKGFLEINGHRDCSLDNSQMKMIDDHLNLVLKKETPLQQRQYDFSKIITQPLSPTYPYSPGISC